jgi:hypothetical protein
MIYQQSTAPFTNVLNSGDTDIVKSITDLDLNWNTYPLNPGNLNIQSGFVYKPSSGFTIATTYSITINTIAQMVIEPVIGTMIGLSNQIASMQANFMNGGGQWSFILAAADTGFNEPGTASFSNSSTLVTGTNTFFLDYSIGDQLYRSDGSTLLGTIASITDDTHLTLVANATGTYNSNFRIRRLCVKWSVALDLYPSSFNSGTLSISCPTASYITKYVGSRTVSYVDSSNGIPLGNGEILVYNTQTNAFMIIQNYLVNTTYTTWNPYWIMIANRDYSSGRIRLGTGEYLKAYAKAYRISALTLTAVSTPYAVFPFDTIYLDNYNGITTGSSFQYVIPYSGYYKFVSRFCYIKSGASDLGNARMMIKNNTSGNEIAETNCVYYVSTGISSSYNNNSVEVSTESEYCNKGDVISVYYWIANAYAAVVNTYSKIVFLAEGQ